MADLEAERYAAAAVALARPVTTMPLRSTRAFAQS
jgi:hypothetical protein